MFRYICLMLILVLSTGNVIRLGKHNQVDLFFWLSFSLLLFSIVCILLVTLKTMIHTLKKPRRIRLRDLKKYDEFW
ncbi:MAG: hypothetical protein HYZ14_16370 [Bacteroidetes bacterium]|nr:hypothetical protein [Bacteroidota bacterium]